MRLLHRLLAPAVTSLANRFSSRPDKNRVDKALSELHRSITGGNKRSGKVINFHPVKDKFIIFSDQHKGARDGADVFALAEKNYIAALEHYDQNNFFYINLGDSEELWENLFITVKRHNKATFQAERKFLEREKFLKIFGNHDLYWDNDPLAGISLQQVYGRKIPIYEGLILRTKLDNNPLEIYLTHGHQGDLQSDGNWFSKWFVSDIWGPLEGWLRINPNTPANNDQLKTAHNRMMYDWSAKQEGLLLITGHTHQPVFRSLTHIEQLYEDLRRLKKEDDKAAMAAKIAEIGKREQKGDRLSGHQKILDTYFNSGCCCFDDGDITGIELEGGMIRLIKWAGKGHSISKREVLGECGLAALRLK
jgi:predicted phosphodiesterase